MDILCEVHYFQNNILFLLIKYNQVVNFDILNMVCIHFWFTVHFTIIVSNNSTKFEIESEALIQTH